MMDNHPALVTIKLPLIFSLEWQFFHDDNTVVYEFLKGGGKVGTVGPLPTQPVTKTHPSRFRYHSQGQIAMAELGHTYDRATGKIQLSLRIEASPGLLAMLMFDRENQYLGILHKEPFETGGSIVQVDNLPTIPNGSFEANVPSNLHHILTVLTNGTIRKFTPSFSS